MNWISIDKGVPEALTLVIVATNKGIGFGTYNPIYKRFEVKEIQGNRQYGSYEISHWMPLPKKP